jgi:type II secretory pathway pseudopilin PulG
MRQVGLSNRAMRSASAARGFTYLGMLFLVIVMGIALASVAEVWTSTAQRDREQELLFAGLQFQNAIGVYYESSPGVKEFPPSLEALLPDARFPTVRRYLRKVYADPMTGKADWGLVKIKDRVVGVFSTSHGEPFLQRVPAWVSVAAGAKGYAEWVFAYSAQPKQ